MEVTQSIREFKYVGVVLKDPGAQYTPEKVRELYANIYPELLNAVIEGPTIAGAKTVYEFRKAVGTKGGEVPEEVLDLIDEIRSANRELWKSMEIINRDHSYRISGVRARCANRGHYFHDDLSLKCAVCGCRKVERIWPIIDRVYQLRVDSEWFRRELIDSDFKTRVVSALLSGGIYYIGELVQRSEKELLRIPNLGRRSLGVIKGTLLDLGLSLNMRIEFKPAPLDLSPESGFRFESGSMLGAGIRLTFSMRPTRTPSAVMPTARDEGAE